MELFVIIKGRETILNKKIRSLRQKFLLLVIISSLLIFLTELLTGNFFLTKFIEYGKQRELRQNFKYLNNISKYMDHKEIHKIQDNSDSTAFIFHDGKVENMEDFPYLVIADENNEIFFVLLSNIIENNPLFDENSFIAGNRVTFSGVSILQKYFVPTLIREDGKNYVDSSLQAKVNNSSQTYKNLVNIHGNIITAYLQKDIVIHQDQRPNLMGQSALLQTLALNPSFLQESRSKSFIFPFKTQVVQVEKEKIGNTTVLLSYNHKIKDDVRGAFEKYITFKFILVILIVFVSLIILDKIIISPIGMATERINKISKGEKLDQLPYEYKDEIGLLFESVNSLNSELEDLIAMYKSQNDNNRQLYKLLNNKAKVYMHEIRTPLSLILGYSKIVKDNLKEMDLQDLSESLDIISTSAETLKSITDLDFDNEHREIALTLNMQKFPLKDLLNLAVKIGKIESNNTKDILIDNSLDPDLSVFADKVRMQQIIWNILNNSILYSKHLIIISIRDLGNMVLVSIKNDGPQISEKDIEQIWEPYFSSSGDSQGLGLHIIKRILNLHNIPFGVKNISEEGMKVEFFFHLLKTDDSN